jgi:hypothetical protein
MPKITCGHCTHVINLSVIPNTQEFECISSQEIDDFFTLILAKIDRHQTIDQQLAILSDWWSEKSSSLIQCPQCGSLIFTPTEGVSETYAKIPQSASDYQGLREIPKTERILVNHSNC